MTKGLRPLPSSLHDGRAISSVEELGSALRPNRDDGEERAPYVDESVPMGRSYTPSQTPALTTSQTEAAARVLMTALESIERALHDARAAGEQISVDAGSLKRLLESGQARTADERALQLEQQLAEERERFRAEREYLLDQQDRFLASMIEEHEAALAEATRERDAVLEQVKRLQKDRISDPIGVAAPTSSPGEANVEALVERLRTELDAARATISRMTAERERSLDMLRRVHAQRDASQRELAQLRRKQFATDTPTISPPSATMAKAEPRAIPTPPLGAVAAAAKREALRAQDRRPTDPAPPPSSIEPMRRTPLVLNDLDAAWDRETYPAPPPAMDPNEPAASLEPAEPVAAPKDMDAGKLGGALRHSPPPMELSAAVLGTTPIPDKRNSSQPVRSKPALHQRPLIGYSVRPGSSESEVLEGARLSSSKPPR